MTEQYRPTEKTSRLVTDYHFDGTEEQRRNEKIKFRSANLSTPDIQHSYSGDPVWVRLDEDGNWESDFFTLK